MSLMYYINLYASLYTLFSISTTEESHINCNYIRIYYLLFNNLNSILANIFAVSITWLGIIEKKGLM